jgi:hypothetical protein
LNSIKPGVGSPSGSFTSTGGFEVEVAGGVVLVEGCVVSVGFAG